MVCFDNDGNLYEFTDKDFDKVRMKSKQLKADSEYTMNMEKHRNQDFIRKVIERLLEFVIMLYEAARSHSAVVHLPF